MKPLYKGDTCRVRLHNGEVVEAVYCIPSKWVSRAHWVTVNGAAYSAQSKIDEEYTCRFVGNPCVLLPVGVSV